MSFASLKKNRGNYEGLRNKVEKLNEKKSFQDDRFWKLEVDSLGNGNAVIRFLSAPEGEEDDFQQMHNHGFEGDGGWFIENCPTTIGGECPLCKANGKLWKTGVQENKDIVTKRKRKLSYYSNIQVISDPKHPEKNGKVFLFRYGQQIFDVILSALNPEEGLNVASVNAFDMWKGANFRLIQKKVKGYPNYAKSQFDAPSPVAKSDDEIETIWSKGFKLKPLVAEDQFKSFDELAKILDDKLYGSTTKERAENATPSSAPTSEPKGAGKSKGAAAKKSAKPVEEESTPWSEDAEGGEVAEDEDDLSMFEKLTED